MSAQGEGAVARDLNAQAVRGLPPVNAVLEHPGLAVHHARAGREAVLAAVRRALSEARDDLLNGRQAPLDAASLALRAAALLSAERPALRKVLNTSGILLHTGLGRSPLAPEAVEAIAEVARGYCNLELDLDTGARGRRSSGVAGLLARLTGSEAATVVNNNAAATVIALRALAAGREVVVSRGQLVEIGGSFRLPEIFNVSGARLREVGTTNRTRLADYEAAIGPETAALLRVHASNYKIVGFTEEAALADLAAVARGRGLFLIDDIGSGALRPDLLPHVDGEPTAAEGIAAGADVVLFSGDKLLGGPQCGLIAGSRAAIARVESDPLFRAFRVDKLTLAALEVTLRLHLDRALALARIPLLASLNTPLESLLERARKLSESLRSGLGLNAEAVTTTARLGGGSVPGQEIPSAAVRIARPFPAQAPSESVFARALRLGELPVIARVHASTVLLDLRALDASEDESLFQAIRRVVDKPAVP